jgi:hypothetical protein
VPCSAERRTSEASSSGERADASSSCGSMPSRRRIAFAVPLKARITIAVAPAKTRMKRWTARAVASGRAIARFFGTSSPNTIVTPVASTSARITAVPSAASSESPIDVSGPSISRAIDGSAM